MNDNLIPDEINNVEDFLKIAHIKYDKSPLYLFEVPIEKLKKSEIINICKMQHFHMSLMYKSLKQLEDKYIINNNSKLVN